MTDYEKIAILREQTGIEPRVKHNGLQTMQELYGTLPGRRCKDCIHHMQFNYTRRYYKCELWRLTRDSTSDIKILGIACRKYERGEGKIITG